MTRDLTYVLIASIAITYAASNAWAIDDRLDETHRLENKSFLEEAASGGLLEIRLGQYAISHASNASVKSFGRQMVQDHEKTNLELKGIAQRSAISLPDTLNERDQQTFNRLTGMTGSEFDREYMKGMVEDHQQNVNAFDHEARLSVHVGKTEISHWAAKTLPTLKQHLEEACDVSRQIGVTPPIQSSKRESHSRMSYVGSVLASVVYLPAKLVFASAGAVTSNVMDLVTAGNTQSEYSIWNATVEGDYMVTPDVIEGTKPLHFVGS